MAQILVHLEHGLVEGAGLIVLAGFPLGDGIGGELLDLGHQVPEGEGLIEGFLDVEAGFEASLLNFVDVEEHSK